MTDNIIKTTVQPKHDMEFATDSVLVPDAWSKSKITMPDGKPGTVDWSFRAYAHKTSADYEPLNMKIRFDGQDGKKHEVIYEPQGSYGTFNGTDPQSYKFAAVTYDGVYKEPLTGNLVNAKDGSASNMSKQEFENGFGKANALLTGVANTREFGEPNIKVTAVNNDFNFGPNEVGNTHTYTLLHR